MISRKRLSMIEWIAVVGIFLQILQLSQTHDKYQKLTSKSSSKV
jgi:hypothetical protein